MKNIILISLTICISAVTIFGQEKSEVPTVEIPLLNAYERTETSPFGRLNPEAPAQTGEFAFMIGTFDCIDSIRNPKDGKWVKSKAVWSSSYFLNGYGIQDKYWSPVTAASGTRIFDVKKGKWIVNYFQSLPGYFAGVWEGNKEGSNMIMRAPRGKAESRLTFSEITKDSFEWIGETVGPEQTTGFWRISCQRRK